MGVNKFLKIDLGLDYLGKFKDHNSGSKIGN